MKLATATDYTYSEMKQMARHALAGDQFAPEPPGAITEEGAPRWSFNYANPEQDVQPDVLVLGDYVHPGTGNELVGGINLNYLDEPKLQSLRQILPKIMLGGDLKHRYHIGKALLPDVFSNFYRTYRNDLITGVQPDELPYWEPDREPQAPPPVPRAPSPPPMGSVPPPGFSPQQPPPEPAPPAPAFAPAAPPEPLRRPPEPVPRPAGPAGPQARQTMAPPRMAPPRMAPPRMAPTGQDPATMDLRALAQAYKQRIGQVRQQQTAQAERTAQQTAIQNLQKERQKNLQDLTTPTPSSNSPQDPLEPPRRQGRLESIEYYSPLLNRYIIEHVQF